MRKTTVQFASLALILSAVPMGVNAESPTANAREATNINPTSAVKVNTESPTANAREVIAKVHEAAKYLHDKGQAGFPDFSGNARWVWKDSYVFVFSCRDNKMIAHPLRPDLVGKPILQMEDDKGNQLFKHLCKAGDNADGGWVEYWWPKPGEAKASRKISYTQSTEVSFQSDVRVGAGIYDDTMSVEELNKLAQQAGKPTKDAP